jgi:hypothetical protein
VRGDNVLALLREDARVLRSRLARCIDEKVRTELICVSTTRKGEQRVREHQVAARQVGSMLLLLGKVLKLRNEHQSLSITLSLLSIKSYFTLYSFVPDYDRWVQSRSVACQSMLALHLL